MNQVSFDYIVIVALPEEATYFREIVSCGEGEPHEGQTIWPIQQLEWRAYGRGVLMLSGRMGYGPARSSAEVAREMGVRLVANVGIAGRVADWLEIGDIVVADQIWNLTDEGKAQGHAGVPDFAHSPDVTKLESQLVQMAKSHLQHGSASLADVNALVRQNLRVAELWPDQGLKVKTGALACVPMVVANDDYRASIIRTNRSILAVDMESAGIVDGLGKRPIEFVSIRGVSDGADTKKAFIEQKFKDENRRFALTAAVTVLDRLLSMRFPRGDCEFSYLTGHESMPRRELERLEQFDLFFAKFVKGSNEEPVQAPITTIAHALSADTYVNPIVLFGGKGVGKTRLVQLVHTRLANPPAGTMQRPFPSILVRIKSLEVWGDRGGIDQARTQINVNRMIERLERHFRKETASIAFIIDGFNMTGNHRIHIVAPLVRLAARHQHVRVLLVAETSKDIKSLTTLVELNHNLEFTILAVSADEPELSVIVDLFAIIDDSKEVSAQDVVADICKKGIREIDLTILKVFFDHFRRPNYLRENTLAGCYQLYCPSMLMDDPSPTLGDAEAKLSRAASIAFEILISDKKNFSDLSERATAKLVSSHSSIANFLVARHVVDQFLKCNKPRDYRKLAAAIDFVFPAEVNRFMKEIITSDPQIEMKVIEVMTSAIGSLTTHGKSHCAYLAGRMSKAHKASMLEFLNKIAAGASFGIKIRSEQERMLRRSIFISRSGLGDNAATKEYVEILLSDVEEADFNRGFHLEYYGDLPFQPKGHMNSRDDGTKPFTKTFRKLMERIGSADTDSPSLISLVTALSLVQIRHLKSTLRQHRKDALELLSSPELKRIRDLPPKVRGYLARMKEDLETENFSLACVLEEWNCLPLIPRTGWLRRKRDAPSDAVEFWKNVRIESVAEHLTAVLGLAESFLLDEPEGDEIYSKSHIIEMLLIHDLAESRLGDQLPDRTHPGKELEELWKYGAFSTYPGIGNLWKAALLLTEFYEQKTVNARIARDLDRLQFVLQARIYGDGMTEAERSKCAAAGRAIKTATVTEIEKLLKAFPAPKRFKTAEAPLD